MGITVSMSPYVSHLPVYDRQFILQCEDENRYFIADDFQRDVFRTAGNDIALRV